MRRLAHKPSFDETPMTNPVKMMPSDATPPPCSLALRFAAHLIGGVLAVAGGSATPSFDSDDAGQASPELRRLILISEFSCSNGVF
jgi:hypothetical protein